MKIPAIKSKDLLTVSDFTKNEILELFDFAAALKRDLRNGIHHSFLEKKTLAMIFEKSSTRTRVSFETGMFQLGGSALFLSGVDIQLGRGESIADTARVMSRYTDGIMIRTFSHEKVIELADNASVPVINGLSDSFHPCQTLTDYFTIYEMNKNLSSVRFAYIGDGNNMANSLLIGAAILGINISLASPKAYATDDSIVEKAKKIAADTGSSILITESVEEAVKGADYLYTDVWVSMGQEQETQRRKKAFKGYMLDRKVLSLAAPGCKVMHCLPAHRGEEITADLIDSEDSIVFDQAENRLHVQKAILSSLMKMKKIKEVLHGR